MKCPGCSFVSSDLRDICPRCLLDLRPHKAALHLPIRFPEANYEELVQKLTGKRLQTSSSAPHSSISSILKSIFASKPITTAVPAQTTKATENEMPTAPESAPQQFSEQQAEQPPQDQDQAISSTAALANEDIQQSSHNEVSIVSQLPTASGPQVLDLSESTEIEGAIDQIFGEVEVHYEKAAPAPKSEELEVEFEYEQEESSENSETLPLQPEMSANASVLEAATQTEPALEEYQPTIIQPETNVEDEVLESAFDDLHVSHTDRAAEIEANSLSQVESEPVEEKPQVILAPGFDDYQIKQLFMEAEDSLNAGSLETTIEFDLGQLNPISNPENLKILFDMSADAILDPNSEKVYVEQVRLSEKKHIRSAALQKQLAVVEKIVSAPVMSLKLIREKRAAKAIKDEQIQLTKLEEAAWHLRLRAFILDLLLLCALSLLITFCYSNYESPQLWMRLSEWNEFSRSDLVLPLTCFSLAFLALLSLYPFFSHIFDRRTLGEYLSGTHVLRSDGRNIKASHCFVRSFCLPLSVLSFGWLPLLFSKNSLHDALARTTVFKSATSNPK